MSRYDVPNSESEGAVLPNKLGITDSISLGKEEAKGFAFAETVLIDELTEHTVFDTEYIFKIHELALSRIYDFAGKLRTVNMSKDGFPFPAAHILNQTMATFQQEKLSRLPHIYKDRAQLLTDIGTIHSELLFIHPFRDGNGRTARILANMMAYKAGYNALRFDPVMKSGENRKEYINAVQQAALEDYSSMIHLMDEFLPRN